MPVFQLTDKVTFPDPRLADESGILAIGGDLNPERLLLAYRMGIFPWFNDDDPLLWWSPDPRMVLFPDHLKISKSMKQVMRSNAFTVTIDTNFRSVITNCQQQPRPGQDGTWITSDILEAYIKLHEMGHAHSIEVWQNNELVGGLYGVALGTCFTGESMFSKASNASKAGFIYLVELLRKKNYKMIDCQLYTKHLASLGAFEIDRSQFLNKLIQCLDQPGIPGSWKRLDKKESAV